MTSLPSFSAEPPAESGLSRSQLFTVFGLAIAASIGLGMVSWGGNIIYPFRLFATWAHEMGHGIGGLITGNSFKELELYRSLGGQALVGGADGFSQVIVSSLGLVGPAILGAVVMVAGSRVRTAPYVLGALAVSVVISVAIWVRNGFGFFAMLLIAAALGLIAKFAPPIAKVAVAQLLAVQMALASWSSRDYLFIKGFERDGTFFDSDTQNIADELFLPYWFWGGLLGGLSVVILLAAFWIAWIRPLTADQESSV
jgi:hypothetical protein